MDDIKIDKGIPIPRKVSMGSMYPIDELEIGDSFSVGLEKRSSIASYVLRFKPKKFTLGKVVEDGVTKLRIWRIA